MRMHTAKIFNVVHMSSFPLFFTSNNHVYHVLTYVVEMFGICESLMTHIKTLSCIKRTRPLYKMATDTINSHLFKQPELICLMVEVAEIYIVGTCT